MPKFSYTVHIAVKKTKCHCSENILMFPNTAVNKQRPPRHLKVAVTWHELVVGLYSTIKENIRNKRKNKKQKEAAISCEQYT